MFVNLIAANIRCLHLQTFVKMVGANVTAMEEQVTQAEGELGTLPSAFKKIFRNMSVPNFLNVSNPCLFYVSWGSTDQTTKGAESCFGVVVLMIRIHCASAPCQKPASPRRPAPRAQQNVPSVFRTDDYFASQAEQ